MRDVKVGCLRCHKVMRTGDIAIELSWPARRIALDCTPSDAEYVRYLCPACADRGRSNQ